MTLIRAKTTAILGNFGSQTSEYHVLRRNASSPARTFPAQLVQERFSTGSKLFFKPFCAVAITARPRLSPIFMPAVLPRMGILDTHQFKVSFPIRTLFLERHCAKTCFHPL